MKKSLLRALSVLMVLAVFLVFTACGSNPAAPASSAPAAPAASAGDAAVPSEESGGTIRFAVSSPLTGDMAEQGFQEVNGAQMAVDKINAAGGVNGKLLELVAMDDMGNPNQATIVAGKRSSPDDSIEFVLAPIFSGCTMAAMPTYVKENISVFGPRQQPHRPDRTGLEQLRAPLPGGSPRDHGHGRLRRRRGL